MKLKKIFVAAIIIILGSAQTVSANWHLTGTRSLPFLYESDAEEYTTYGEEYYMGSSVSDLILNHVNYWFNQNETVDRKMTYFRPDPNYSYDSRPDSYYYPTTFCSEYFKDCTELQYADFGERPAIIQNNCFENCTALKTVRFGQTNYKEDYIFNGPYASPNWTYKLNNSRIGTGAFVNCPSLERVIIDGLETEIRGSAFINCGNITIYCHENSKAEAYAKKHNINYVIMPTVEQGIVYGDADADGILTASDAAAIMQKVLRQSWKMNVETVYPNDYMKYVDVDNSGTMDASDAAYVMQKVIRPNYYMPAETPDWQFLNSLLE